MTAAEPPINRPHTTTRISRRPPPAPARSQECISQGKPLLLTGVSDAVPLPPVLEPVLERRLAKRGRRLVMVLPDKEARAIFVFLSACMWCACHARLTPTCCALATHACALV